MSRQRCGVTGLSRSFRSWLQFFKGRLLNGETSPTEVGVKTGCTLVAVPRRSLSPSQPANLGPVPDKVCERKYRVLYRLFGDELTHYVLRPCAAPYNLFMALTLLSALHGFTYRHEPEAKHTGDSGPAQA